MLEIGIREIQVVLVTEREEVRREILAELSSRGLVPAIPEDREAALQAIRATPPDLVVLDLEAPFEFLGQLRSAHSGDSRNLPVLLLTEPGKVPDRELSFRYRLDDFLMRPFLGEELASRVTSLGRLGVMGRRWASPHLLPSHEDLLLARAVQQNLLPIPLPTRRGVQLACCYIPSEQLSGDFFDVIDLDQDSTGFFLADVVGHGVSAALFTSFLKAQLMHWSLSMQTQAPSETLWDMNQSLCKVFSGSGRFVTAIYATFEPGIERLHFANAGHPPPVYLPREGDCYLLDGGEIPLGIDPGTRFQTREIRFAPGDRVFLLTDGIFEQRWHGDGPQFGKSRVTGLLLDLRAEPLEESIRTLRTELARWAGDHPFEDDINILALEAEDF